ncbi:MAG: hypothetical protein J6U25_03870 [Clostridia bacterium]|nr:hypothetical protein [Clostridia bacterium]
MNKNLKYYLIVWLVGVAAFNAVNFLIPNVVMGVERFSSGLFWVSFAFVNGSFLGQLVTGLIFFKADSKNKAFLKIPVVYIGYSAVGVAIVVGILTSSLPIIRAWIGSIVVVAITFYFMIAAVFAHAVYHNVEVFDENLNAKTSFIKTMRLESQALIKLSKTQKIEDAANSVYEAFRFSDPVSNEGIEDVENEIMGLFEDFSIAVKSGDEEKTAAYAEKIINKINDRNVKIKALKR